MEHHRYWAKMPRVCGPSRHCCAGWVPEKLGPHELPEGRETCHWGASRYHVASSPKVTPAALEHVRKWKVITVDSLLLVLSPLANGPLKHWVTERESTIRNFFCHQVHFDFFLKKTEEFLVKQ